MEEKRYISIHIVILYIASQKTNSGVLRVRDWGTGNVETGRFFIVYSLILLDIFNNIHILYYVYILTFKNKV